MKYTERYYSMHEKYMMKNTFMIIIYIVSQRTKMVLVFLFSFWSILLPLVVAGTTDILNFILHYVPDAYISEEIGMELTMVLPTNKHQAENFPRLFSTLDSHLHDLCIQSYGISDSTLEEVFLKLVKQAENKTLAGPSSITKAVETDEIKVDQNSTSKESLSVTSFGSTQ